VLSGLNPPQKKAVRHTDTPLLVLAGAGSGKTTVITRKIAWLIQHNGIEPQHIVALTFTNKAAREMKSRIISLSGKNRGKEYEAITISTFHALGLKIISAQQKELGLRKGFNIIDSEDCRNIIKNLMSTDQSGDKQLVFEIQQAISSWKGSLIGPHQALADFADTPATLLAAKIYEHYNKTLLAYNVLDFDDLVYLPVKLLNEHDALCTKWQSRIKYFLVDEYQDTNKCQYELVKTLVGNRSCLTVVGDDDQSIYTWRGAQPENLSLLAEDFADLQVIKLEQNYRSSGRILKVANQLIANNSHLFNKKLWSDLGYGDQVNILETKTDAHEAKKIVADIQYQVFRHRRKYQDYAILYRSNHQSRTFEKVLTENNIPYYLSGGTSFFERTEIKDMLCYLRLIANPDDDAAFLRIVNTPRRHIGTRTLTRLGEHAASNHLSMVAAARESSQAGISNQKSLARLNQFILWLDELASQSEIEPAEKIIKKILEDINYTDWLRDVYQDEKAVARRIESINELTSWVTHLGHKESLAKIVSHILLMGNLDGDQDKNDHNQVSLMTLHASKGLEFPYVYLAGIEEGILPHHACQDDDGISEERRLAYVGITRAQKNLTLSYAVSRKKHGEQISCEPSRFLAELPEDDLNWVHKQEQNKEEKQQRGDTYLSNIRALLDNA
jgi:ATP-dependent DNA helicase Rep